MEAREALHERDCRKYNLWEIYFRQYTGSLIECKKKDTNWIKRGKIQKNTEKRAMEKLTH